MGKRYCTKCGSKNNNKSKYCTKCGRRLSFRNNSVIKDQLDINKWFSKSAILISISIVIILALVFSFNYNPNTSFPNKKEIANDLEEFYYYWYEESYDVNVIKIIEREMTRHSDEFFIQVKIRVESDDWVQFCYVELDYLCDEQYGWYICDDYNLREDEWKLKYK